MSIVTKLESCFLNNCSSGFNLIRLTIQQVSSYSYQRYICNKFILTGQKGFNVTQNCIWQEMRYLINVYISYILISTLKFQVCIISAVIYEEPLALAKYSLR